VFPNTGLHLYGDINGYFTDTFNTGNQVLILGNIGNQSVLHVDNASSADGSRAILGNTSATTGFTWGVLGHSNSSGGGSAGVRGAALAPSGRTYGVFGETLSLSAGSAGVLGLDGGGLAAGHTLYTAAGVRGESRGLVGVFGVTEQFIAVRGVLVNPATGDSLAEGHLGSSGAMDYGVFSQGPYGGTGAKYFVEPHPEKADMVIRYVSLEGNESGTYFRGRGKFQNGLATIEVPEDFRLVTDRENLSIQVTPIGEMASVAVRSIGLDRIVVRGSRNVEFFYTVNGVRKTHKHLTPIGPGREYMPETADAKMPLYLTEGQKEMLISNGTYTENGTVNMETARRLGWDKEWEKRGRPAPQPSD
jgi:hypothetical protein